MNTIIRWSVDKKLYFLGRNGYGKCTGLEVSLSDGVVELWPFTSKNKIGPAQLRLPVAALSKLMKALERIQHQVSKSNKSLRRSKE